MKNYEQIEEIEKNTYECMNWMENKIKVAVENLMKLNDENLLCLEYIESPYDRGYVNGIHDGLLDLLKALDIDTDEEYYN